MPPLRVFVTGASGMLGAATARALAEAGHDVTTFQRRPAPHDLRHVSGDITDAEAVREACAGHDAVVHLAAKVSLVGEWDDYRRINIDGTASLLDTARDVGVQRFVYVSSPSVAHGGSALVGVGAQPADPARAEGNYAKSKAEAEQRVLAANDVSMLTTALRPHLVWGPGDTQLVARIIERARAGRLALIDGGTALIDTTYVTNAADAIVAGLGRTPEIAGDALVVSNGEPRPVADILAKMCGAAGVAAPSRSVPLRAARAAGAAVEAAWARTGRDDEPPMTRFLATQLATAHWFDQRETRARLAWRPAVGLDEGFQRLDEHFANQGSAGQSTKS